MLETIIGNFPEKENHIQFTEVQFNSEVLLLCTENASQTKNHSS